MGLYLNRIKEIINGKQICVYPLGVGGKKMLEKLEELGIDVDFVGDKNLLRGDCPKTIGLPRINLSYVCTLKTE